MKNHQILLENALDAVVGADSSEKIIYWNLQAENIFGWSKNESIGHDMADLIVPERYREAHRRGMKHYLNTGIGPILNQRIEISAIRRDGTEFPCELTVTPIQDGESLTFFSFIRDLTSQKEAEKEKTTLLENAQASAQQAYDAVLARDEFLAICSHELKTPVTSLLLQFELAEKKIERNDPQVLSYDTSLKRVQSATRQLHRLSRLIDDMLDVSRIAIGKLHLNKTSFDLPELLHELVDRFELQASGGVIEIQCDSGNGTIEADRGRIEQVFTNLITNGIKYGNGQPLRIELKHEGSSLKVSVVDQGPGIATENLERIFEKFERGGPNPSISGMGVGLFISRAIVQAHGGTISATSTLSQGATFTVILPISE